MSREIKFRQAIFKDGKFHHWHYWGFCGHRGDFVAPIRIKPAGDSIDPIGYEVKESQQYTGIRCGPVSVGKEIYEGDIARYIIPEDEPVNIRTTGQIVWNPADAHFIFKRLDNDRVMFIHGEIIEIIGNIYENGDLLNEH